MANFNTGLTKQQIITALSKALDSMSEQEVQSAIATAIAGKQDVLTFDSTPTSDSSNPVTSDGIYADQQRQDAAEQQDRAALITQVDGGAKNTIDASDFASQTKNGITLTKNTDDSFTITGTFTSHQTSFFTIDVIEGTAGTVLAFEGGENGIYAYARNGNPASWLTSSGGVPITTGVPIPDQNVGAQFDIAIMVNNADGKFDDRAFDKTVRIMICKASDYAISPAFVPYAPTNRELYEMILALQSGRSVQSAPASLMQAGLLNSEETTDKSSYDSEGVLE